MADTITVQGVRVPWLMYGTAWKDQRTESLTALALATGFRAIDTANQRKHYFEAGVGAACAASGVPRDQLFLQTKFTFVDGQDHRLPYDPAAPVAAQVRASFASSLEHLGVAHVDSYVLHGPRARGWGADDREAWRAMEALHGERRARLIGVSNVSLAQLQSVVDGAQVAPAFVQNRCYARTGWDREVRAFCASHAIIYQGFSLLTANQRELAGATAKAIAKRLDATVAQVVFGFAHAVGMLPLTGTSDRAHMLADLAGLALPLSAADVAAIARIGTP